MVVTEDEINDEFEDFDIKITNDAASEKLIDLCSSYRIDAVAITAEWIAFTASKQMENKHVTVENLDQMDRHMKKKQKTARTPKTPASRKKPTISFSSPAAGIDFDEADELVDAYATPNSAKKSIKRQHTPDAVNNKRISSINRTPTAAFSPSNFSPNTATPSQTYGNRDKRGDVVCSHGAKDIAWMNIQNEEKVSVEVYDKEIALTKQFKYMFQKTSDKALILNDIVDEAASLIKDENDLQEYSPLSYPNQDIITVAGRIKCDGQGRLNAKSILLEGSRETSSGKCIPVDVSGLAEYSFFPGQIVAFEGLNLTGSKFVAKKCFQSSPPPQPKIEKIEGDMHIMVACGPFTTTDSLLYEPLTDLLTVIQRDRPDICILMGPFVDSKSENIQNLEEMTYDELFLGQLQAIVRATEGLHTQIVVVPSSRDAHHDFVFPQAPFHVRDNHITNKIRFMSDPCTISVNGVVIGMTSNDILFHLGSLETSHPPGSSDRMKKLSQHLIKQQMYYPLYPPGEDINIEFEKFKEHGTLNVTPHILILPSDLRYFIKDCYNCCCINPSRLTKNKVGGTFARVYVPMIDPTKPLMEQISAQILKI